MAITGLDKLNAKLRRMEEAPKREIRQELHKQADRVVVLAKALAPHVEGDLRGSIRKEPGRHELAVAVKAGGLPTTRPVREGVTAPSFDYSREIERKSPFFFPAYRALKGSIRAGLGKAYKRAAGLRVGGGR